MLKIRSKKNIILSIEKYSFCTKRNLLLTIAN